jgi:predicted patatin/cPLA2 family phospholipase
MTETAPETAAGETGEDTAEAAAHDVLRVLAERTRSGSRPGRRADGLRVALAIEGGGMRGTISGGMALALHERGLLPAFDAVYGASSGAITGAWLLSSRPEGLRGWADPVYANALIRWSNFLRGRPVVDVRTLIEKIYVDVFPLDFQSVLDSVIEYHPLATDAVTGVCTDLRPLLGDPVELRRALRASAALPVLAGPPVEIGGRHFYDAGLSESIPYRTAIAQHATHILILRTRRHADVARPSRSSPLIARTALRRSTPMLRGSFLARDERLADDDARLADYDMMTVPGDGPAILSIRPTPASPQISRLTRDGNLLTAALEAGREAVLAVVP